MLTTLALIALSQWPQHRIFEQPNLRRLNGREEPTYLTFADPSGAGLPAISHHNTALCDALAAEAPNWNTPVDGGAGNWCLGGDGLSVAGSELTFETFGSPEVIETPVCPSGLDCLAATGQPVQALQTGTGQGSAASAAVASGTGAMTACWWGKAVSDGQKFLASNSTAYSNAGIGWTFEQATGISTRAYVSDGVTAVSATAAEIQIGRPSIACMTFAGGMSVVKAYVDGVKGADSSATARQSISAKPTLSGINSSSGVISQDNFGAFYVDQELSAAQIAAIARRVLADQPKAIIRGKTELPLTYARTGTRFCSRADNTGSLVPSGRPCIARNGYLSEGAATNVLLRSQEFNVSPWVANGGTTVTANYGIAPDGTKTAERVQFPACVAGFSELYQDMASASRTNSIYIKGVSGSGSLSFCAYGPGLPCVECAFTPDAWNRCVRPADTNISFMIGCVDYAAYTGFKTTAAADVLLWGAQAELGTVATSYIPTTSAAASRGADLGEVTVPTVDGARMQTDASWAATLIPANNASSTGVEWAVSGSEYAPMDNYSDGTTRFARCQSVPGGQSVFVVTQGAHRMACAKKASTTQVLSDGVGGPTPSHTPWANPPTRLGIGRGVYGAGSSGSNFISNVCLDPRPTRCR